jgi:hypothetical protein
MLRGFFAPATSSTCDLHENGKNLSKIYTTHGIDLWSQKTCISMATQKSRPLPEAEAEDGGNVGSGSR